MSSINHKTRDREQSLNSITIYIDTEKRQSISISAGSGHRTVEKLMKDINANPSHYQHQNCVIIDIIWKGHIWKPLLIIFIIVVLLTFFFAFFPEHLLSIWKRDIWLYICIAFDAFVIITVCIYYLLQYCDRSRWTKNELNRINHLIDARNNVEHDKQEANKKETWIDWTDSEDECNPKNINNLHYVYLKAVPLSKRERKEDVIKMVVQIWLENKSINIRNHMSNVEETQNANHGIDGGGETQKLITHKMSEDKQQHIVPNVANETEPAKSSDHELVAEMQNEDELQHMLTANDSNAD